MALWDGLPNNPCEYSIWVICVATSKDRALVPLERSGPPQVHVYLLVNQSCCECMAVALRAFAGNVFSLSPASVLHISLQFALGAVSLPTW